MTIRPHDGAHTRTYFSENSIGPLAIRKARLLNSQGASMRSVPIRLQSAFSPAMTYAHKVSISEGSSTSSHGGMLRLPLITESTNRSWPSRGNVRRSNAHCGLRMRVPWHVAQWRANRAAPFLTCSGANSAVRSCAEALAQSSARPKVVPAIAFMSWRITCAYSGISAKVHTEPPVGVRSATFITRLSTPPMPDSTVTYCRPLWV
jgi:hypothetical protein